MSFCALCVWRDDCGRDSWNGLIGFGKKVTGTTACALIILTYYHNIQSMDWHCFVLFADDRNGDSRNGWIEREWEMSIEREDAMVTIIFAIRHKDEE